MICCALVSFDLRLDDGSPLRLEKVTSFRKLLMVLSERPEEKEVWRYHVPWGRPVMERSQRIWIEMRMGRRKRTYK
jgi:hypothetical protein